MNQAVVIWLTVVCILLTFLLFKTFSDLFKGWKHHFIGMGSEQDLIFCPGDRKEDANDDL